MIKEDLLKQIGRHGIMKGSAIFYINGDDIGGNDFIYRALEELEKELKIVAYFPKGVPQEDENIRKAIYMTADYFEALSALPRF